MELLRYVDASGKVVITEWLSKLKDVRAKSKILARLTRLIDGNFGDCKPIQDGVWEMRIDTGPGYRVYYAAIDQVRILLLCSGDKRKQPSDIQRAIEYWKDYKKREGIR
jgi:putative addiction module killer protein